MKIHLLAPFIGVLAAGLATSSAVEWPQWRGPNRDARVQGFEAPERWPEGLTKKWEVSVGDGVATPALVKGRLYVFSRQNDNEVLRCLDAATGKEIWSDRYEALGATGPASGFSGPRSSPAVRNGKVVTIGVRGMISCLDAETGKPLWRKDEFRAWPQFFASSSPIILGDVVVAQLGGRENGAIVAYGLNDGVEKWKWSGSSPAYSSPILMEVGGARLIVAQTEAGPVAIHATDGTLAWEVQPEGGRGGRRGGGRDYRAATPIVNGQTLIIAGQGITAFALEKQGLRFSGRELWRNGEVSVQFNSPVLKDGYLYGLTPRDDLFCASAEDGDLAWSVPYPAGASDSAGAQGGGRGRGRGGVRPGYGSILDAGSVLVGLTPRAQLIVFKPNAEKLDQVASYKVAESPTYAHPVFSEHGVHVKDQESVTLWSFE